MSRTYVIGVDTGLSCGLLALGPEGRRFAFWQGHIDRLAAYLRALRIEICDAERGSTPRVLVGCERFVRRTDRGNARTRQSDAETGAGIVRALVDEFRWELFLQSPADVKNFASNADLRRFNLWHVGREVDAPDADDVNDAARHALTLLATRCSTAYRSLLDGAT